MSIEQLQADCRTCYQEYINSYNPHTRQMSTNAAAQYDYAVKRLIAGLKAAGGTALEDYYAWCAGGKSVEAMTASAVKTMTAEVKEVERETQLRHA